MSETKGLVHSLESFGSVDGPGIRFLVFLQGCPLRCKYCHNADTWALEGNATTKEYTVKEILDQAIRYKSYWKNNGGITVSGGEPLVQIDFLLDLFNEAKNRGINTCIDTSGQPFTRDEPFFSKFEQLMKVTDTLLVDIKHIDDNEHVLLTGKHNDNIQDMFKYLNDINKPVWVRHVLVPGITDDDHYLQLTKEFIHQFSNIEKVDVLPYHTLGKYKWDELGYKYPLEGVPSPTKERIENARNILCINK